MLEVRVRHVRQVRLARHLEMTRDLLRLGPDLVLVKVFPSEK